MKVVMTGDEFRKFVEEALTDRFGEDNAVKSEEVSDLRQVELTYKFFQKSSEGHLECFEPIDIVEIYVKGE